MPTEPVTLEQIPIRLELSTVSDPPVAPVDINTGNTPKAWRAQTAGVAIGIFDGDLECVDLSNLAYIQFVLQATEDAIVPLMVKQVVGGLIVPTISRADWLAGIAQQCTFNLTSGDLDQSLAGGSSAELWCVVQGVTEAGATIVYGAGSFTLYNPGGQVPAPVPSYVSTHAQTLTTGTTATISPASQLHLEVLTLAGAARTIDVAISLVGLVAGARPSVLVVFPATSGIIVNLRNSIVSGTIIQTIASSDYQSDMTRFDLRYDGAALQVFGGSDVQNTIQITYTGTLLKPLYFSLAGPRSVLWNAASGSPVAMVNGKAIANGVIYFETNGPGVPTAGTRKGRGLVTISFDNIEYSASGLTIAGCSLLTDIAWPKLKAALTLSFSACPVLTSLSFPLLSQVDNVFNLTGFSLLATISLPSFKYSSLDVTISSMAVLTTLSMPVLESLGRNLNVNTNASLTTLSFPSLVQVGASITFSSMASLTTIFIPSLVATGDNCTINSSLGNVTTVTGFGTVGVLKEFNGSLNISGQKLTQASVDHILALIASLDGTNGTASWGTGKTLTLNGGTNSTPSAQGLIDKATIQARGATVLTN